ncbi:hypothetical protein [Marinoscillum sp. MHG1-6]|uniref:hypothetical protein n=1 Tax=Marinoscillum sp. MHG1-6 TaxID=2959627 RepID=UPI0021570A8B|nr:hypothetical protein [Marinoscillum sp. MHG1-6]
MKNLSRITLWIVLLGLITSCHATYYKVKMTKPKRHFFGGYYDDSKDRKKKRIKTVRYKSLKSTKGINASK